MLTSNTMRYGTDEISFNKQSLLSSRVPFDCTNVTSVEGFTIFGAEPTGTERKLLFQVDGNLYKFTDGALAQVDGDAGYSTVLNSGNTVTELEAVTNVPDWVGKKIYPLIALYAPTDATVFPSIQIGLKTRSSAAMYEKTVETAITEFSTTGNEMPRIVDVTVEGTTTGNGAYNVTAQVRKDNVWSEYLPVQNVKDMDAVAIRFRIRYTVSKLDSGDSAKVTRIVTRHTSGTSAVSGDTAEIYSVMRDYKYPLGTCALTVRHKRMIDSKIFAYVNFAESLKSRTYLPLGISNGVKQTLILGKDGVADEGVDQSSLKLYTDGVPLVEFDYNTEVGTVTISVPAGKAISASYDYGRSPETWREMSIDVDQEPFDDGSYLTRFTYSIPDEDLDNQTVTNVRMQLKRTSGTVTDEYLGVATGAMQQFVLAHAAKSETLEVNAEFSYDADSQVLTCTAPEGTEIRASYDWLGESHTIYTWAAAWSPTI